MTDVDRDPNDAADRPVDTEATREELLRFLADEPTEYGLYDAGRTASTFLELPKLELAARGRDTPPLVTDHFDEALDLIDSRGDCGDFVLTPLLRVLYQYPESELLDEAYRERIEDAVLEYIYWFDEPGEQHIWFTTENHQILFHGCELLAGQYFPDRVFPNGEDGEWHRRHAETYVERWLDWRAQFGFSEWNSNCYYDEDLIALFNIADYAANDTIRRKARSVIDLITFDVAVNSFDGTFGSTHGRSYGRLLVNPDNENTSPLTYLLWGEGSYERTLSRSAVMLAVSDYRVPSLVQKVALDDERSYENFERHSLDVEDAPRHGVDPTAPDDLPFFFGASLERHRDVVDTALEVCPVRFYLKYPMIEAAHDYHRDYPEDPGAWRRGHAGDSGYEPNPASTAMSQADVYTYRTPEYMLSCAQDYRKGERGFQQHVWQATLAGRAVVFATHPGAEHLGGRSRPGSWHGNDVLPRAAAHRNVLVSLHRFDTDGVGPGLQSVMSELGVRPDPDDTLGYTHAFFPRYAFDEWDERGGWVCGRTGEGYVGIRSLEPTRWIEPARDVVDALRPLDAGDDWHPGACELRADSTENAWLCELGSARSHGSFESFVDGLGDATISGDVSGLRYESPSRGLVEFGWDAPFVVDGARIPLDDYPRFDNPYCETDFGATRYELGYGDERLDVDFDVD